VKENGKKGMWVDISAYDVSNPVRQGGHVWPHTFSRGFQSYRYAEHELEAACPKCGNKKTVCLGSYLSCDLSYNVFACMDCQIAWSVFDQPGGHLAGCVNRVEALVRTLYDPGFTPDDEYALELTGFLRGQREPLPQEDIACGLGWTEDKTRRILDVAEYLGFTHQLCYGAWELIQ